MTIEEREYGSSILTSLENNLLKLENAFGNKIKDDKDVASCAICTVLVGMMQQYAYIHGQSIDEFIMHGFCPLLSGELQEMCKVAVKLYGPKIIEALTVTQTADGACRYAKYCTGRYTQCTLFPKKTSEVTMSPNWSRYVLESNDELEISVSPFEWLLNLIKKSQDTLVPLSDKDGDLFSPNVAVSRGYHWRGRDCDDLDAKIRPGRKTDPYPGRALDFNCNGIKGKDPQTKKDYKELLCANSNQMGVALIGDSAGIFAQIPNEWATAADWNKTTLSTILPTILDQGGHPQFSAYTGYEDEGYHGTVHSVYKNLYARNKCNFRDYQNLAVSGASSGGTLSNAKLLSRNQKDDNPLLVIMELAANDVCFGEGTQPDQFKTNIINILNHLDTVLPPGSHLFSLGLVNGSMIHEIMGGNTHPMGMSYDVFYDYLNCMDIDLCGGYLTSNLTKIAITTAHAMKLNQVYKDIFSTYKAKNYDILHYPFPADIVMQKWKDMGGNPFELLSHVDGFHPSQAFNMLLGDFIWDSIMRDKPEWLGPVNPNNELIEKLFGNQGGY